MDGVAAFQEEYSALYLASLSPEVRDLLLQAFLLGYEANKVDAARYRFVVDEVIQDARGMGKDPGKNNRPLGLAIACFDPFVNLAGNHNISSWAVSYDVDADRVVDEAMEQWVNSRKKNQ